MSTKAKRECLSFQCTNRLGKTNCLSSYVVSRLSKMCIVSKKKKRATNAFIEDLLLKTNYQAIMKNFLSKCSMKKRTANYSTTLKTEEYL